MSGKIMIYGAGGAGVNIASQFLDREEEAGYAIVRPVFVDTSRSNIKSNIPNEACFILDEVDGSGKVRRENAELIGNSIKQMLLQHKPLDMNVVVFSASGGSGSVFGPLIIGELLERGFPVVACVVGSDESVITCQNTMNTLKTLDAIAKKHDKPVVMYYDHNQRGVRRSDIDESMVTAIGSLAILGSRQNAEMDTADIANFLAFNRVSDVRAQLSLLSIFESNERADQTKAPVSIASLYTSPDEPSIEAVPDYHCVGYSKALGNEIKSLHFVISVNDVPEIAKGIQRTLDSLDEIRQSRVATASLVSNEDEVADNGLVL